MQDNIDDAAARLAEAERRLADKQREYDFAMGEVSLIRDRIAELNARRSELLNQHRQGGSNTQLAIEFAAIEEDLGLLQTAKAKAEQAAVAKMHTAADIRAVDEARRFLAYTEALQDRAREIDALLVDCIAEIKAAGRDLGNTVLWTLWRPSDALDRTIRYELPPPMNAHLFQPGKSGNQLGRPIGTGDRSARVLRLIEARAEEIAERLVAQALAGDTVAAGALLVTYIMLRCEKRQ